MRTTPLHEADGLRTFAVVFDKGDEPIGGLSEFARSEAISGAGFTAVGAFSRVLLAYFDPDQNDYIDVPVDEQVEVLSMLGDVALADGTPEIHAHVVLGRRDASTVGGHLREASVYPTLEVIVTETPKHLTKRHDRETGLTLIDPNRAY